MTDYHLLLDVSGAAIDTESVDWLLQRSEPGSRTLVLIHDSLRGDPLVRCSDIVARCRAAGVQVVVRTTTEQEHLEARGLLSVNRQNLASPDSDAVIDAASRAGPKHAPVLPGTAALADAFVEAQDLPDGPASRAPANGPMAAHLGERISAELLMGEDMLIEHAVRIRAWPVRSLIGTAFVANDEQDIARALQTHVQGILGVPVLVPGEHFGGCRKYLHMHASAPTPPDPSSDQPMFLELYGHIALVGDHDLRTFEGAIWQRRYHRRTREDHRLEQLPGPLVVRLEAATWANVSYPGFDVPFYM